MKTKMVSVRLADDVFERIRAYASEQNRTGAQVVELCVLNFFPVLESGVFGTPIWRDMKARWDADLAEAVAKFDSVRRGQPSARASARKAAA